jgi:hypothetical protein
MKKIFKQVLFATYLLLLLAIILVGCSPQVPLSKTYSIADLAELSTPSIAYIEAWDSEAPDFYYIGSGFVISGDGLVITNYHVMEDSDKAMIEIDGEQYFDVSVLAYDANWDLAVLKVEADNLKPLRLAKSVNDSRLGEEVIAMGSPEGFKQTLSDGIISSLYRRVEGYDFDHIQTTALMSKGSSGGPLLNMQGEVIGVNTFTYGQSLNFAVPIDYVNNLISDIGQPQSLAEVFKGDKVNKPTKYEYLAGQLAVVLSWEGNIDLDLEIWTEDFQYIDLASELCESPDITNGTRGEEWFVFEGQYVDFEGKEIDFTTGRYVVSVYYHGPEPDDGMGEVDAEITIALPDGTMDKIQIKELLYSPPYDQWFAVLIDVETQESKTLDLFIDAPIVALLEWDTLADLDLLVWADYSNEILRPTDFWYGHDFISGLDGIESFRFSSGKNIGGQFYDFSKGLVDIFIAMDTAGDPETNAKVTLITSEYDTLVLKHKFIVDPAGEYVWLAIYDFDLETQKYTLPSTGDERVYLDE